MAEPLVIRPDNFVGAASDWSREEGYVADCAHEDIARLFEHSDFLAAHPAHLFVPTSGSSGTKKWVALPLKGLQVACEQFNRYFKLNESTSVLNSLPLSHIGGIMALLRARQGKYSYQSFLGPWSPSSFYEFLKKEHITFTPLVPTQLHDLVSLGYQSPSNLRVLIGGAPLSKDILNKAQSLGWKLTLSYGATETGALIATSTSLEEPLVALPHVKVEASSHGTLQVSGPSVASAVLNTENKLIHSLQQIWQSEDAVEFFENGSFHVIGRTDGVYKNKGRKQSLHAARAAWQVIVEKSPNQNIGSHTLLMNFAHPREGQVLGLAAIKSIDPKVLEAAIATFNQLHDSQFGPIQKNISYDAFPRLENQKIAVAQIKKDLEEFI